MNDNDLSYEEQAEIDAEFLNARARLTTALESLAEEAHGALDDLHSLEVGGLRAQEVVSRIVASRRALERALNAVESAVGLPASVKAR
jgi:hypothetical protein